ncbi:MAG: tRNA pseudouridine(54/55) synthase Pus10 [Crenarchaeota archaeon]|nr:tRNA pseudouridine(54/55) synthase Pus10 [Thermoproteota archaeon]MDA1124030.1 tRNA pseudouridine(54/55) synthase Pus10 [Thermoproteota archaeon]
MKSQSVPISKILKNYDLCEYCAGRLVSKLIGKPSSKSLGKKYLKKFGKSSNTKCYVCKNIFENLDYMLSNIFEKSSNLDFKTFNLGLILKNSFLERDDHIKSKFKIKGIENIKFGISIEMAKKISRRTKSTQIVNNPDLFIQANFKDESCIIRTKPIFVYGRYNKKIRKLPQKQMLCKSCNGIGCHNCNFKGLENIESIEGKISNLLIKKFEGNQVKINWIGGEDQSSLVLGNGRPFFAKILNPKKRNRILRKSLNLDAITLSELKKILIQPKGSIPFKSKVSVIVDTEKPISLTNLKKLDILENTKIHDPTKDKKILNKQIYQIRYKKLGKTSFRLDLFADGGIPIKFFIQNSDVTPNISELLGNRCQCRKIDFKNIIV